MSPEVFKSYVRQYCTWADAPAHDLATVHDLLLQLLQGVPGLKTSAGRKPGRKPVGLPRDVPFCDVKRFADLPFQCYAPSFWPQVHPDGQFTDNIHVDLAHIYAELRHGLQLMEQGDAESAIDYWHDSYFFHWGHHAAAAVWAMEDHDPKLKRAEPIASRSGGPAERSCSSGATGAPPRMD